MISLFLQNAFCRTVTGKYSQSKLWDTLREDLLIVDCVFSNLGGWAAYAPVWIDGGQGNRIEVIRTMFLECSAQTNGPFAFEGDFFLKFDQVVDARNTPGSGNKGVMGRISTSGHYNLTMSSFVDNKGGTRNLRLENTPDYLESLNVSGSYASASGQIYAYGNVILDTVSTSPVISWCNFESDESSCGILYFASASGTNLISHCNFVNNKVTGWGMIVLDNSGPTTIKDTIFYGNTYENSPLVYSSKNGEATINNCYVDNAAVQGKIAFQKFMVTSKKPYEMYLFATERIHALFPYDPENPAKAPPKNNTDTDITPGYKPSTENNTIDGNHSAAQEGNSTGFLSKKVGSLKLWMVFVIVGCVLVVCIVGFIIYKKKKSHHHHHHHHHHHEEDEDNEGEDENEEQDAAADEEAPQP